MTVDIEIGGLPYIAVCTNGNYLQFLLTAMRLIVRGYTNIRFSFL